MSTLRPRRFLGLAIAVALTASCGVLPPLPSGAPSPATYVPEITPPPPLDTSLLTAEGIATTQAMAVRIRNIGCDNFFATGTGFAIDEYTLISNKHVVEDTYYLQVETYDGTDVTVAATAVASLADLALVRVESPLPTFPTLAPADPEVGDHVTVVGYPKGGQLTVTEGTILRFVPDPFGEADGKVLLSDAKIQPGSSGSAALNDKGEVIGVAYASNDKDQSYLVPVEMLRRLLTSTDGFTPLPPCESTPILPE